MMRVIFIILFMAAMLRAQADNVVYGTVCDNDSVPLPGVIVKVVDGEDDIYAYCATDVNGYYELKYETQSAPLSVSFAFMGFQPVTIPLTENSRREDVVLEPSAVKLREVTVKVRPVSEKGDTLVYNVGAFRSFADRTLEDVIKKMPGITVANTGEISYNGKAINKFYIEGIDGLSGRYSLATKNINPDDVAFVHIYENHQPKRVLKDVEFSDRAAINLKLKKDRIIKPIGYVKGGAGYSDETKWLGEIFAMEVAKKNQTLLAVKGNNYGISLNENLAFGDGQMNFGTPFYGIFSTTPLGTAGIADNRYYLSTSAGGSLSNILKISDSKQLNVVADYKYDNDSYDNATVSKYYVSGAEPVTITEEGHSRLKTSEASATVKYENNSSSLYVGESFQFNAKFTDNEYKVRSGRNVDEGLVCKEYCFGNRFSINGKVGRRVLQLNSEITVSNLPVNYIKANSDDGALSLLQRAKSFTIYTRHNSGISWQPTSVTDFGVKLAVATSYDKLESGMDETYVAGNDIYGYKIRSTVTPYVQLKFEKFRMNFSVPVEMHNMRYTDREEGNRYSYNEPVLNCRLDMRYAFRSNRQLTLSASTMKDVGDIRDFVLNPIYTSYRDYTTMGSGVMNERRSYSVVSTYSYRNVISGLFFNTMVLYRHSRRTKLIGSVVSANANSTEVSATKNSADIVEANMQGKKSVYDWRTTFGIDGYYSFLSQKTMRQGTMYGIKSHQITAKGHADYEIIRQKLIFTVSGVYTYSIQNISLSKGTNNLSNYNIWGRVSYNPLSFCEIYVRSDYSVNQLDEKTYQRDLFLDAGSKFTAKRFEIELMVRNITNRRQYVVTRFLDADVFLYCFDMRPISALVTLRYSM